MSVDAMRPARDGRCLLGRRVYVISAIKDNPAILEDLKAIDFSDAPWHETVDKGHGRIERPAVPPSTSPAPNGPTAAEPPRRPPGDAQPNASSRSSRPAEQHRSDLEFNSWLGTDRYCRSRSWTLVIAAILVENVKASTWQSTNRVAGVHAHVHRETPKSAPSRSNRLTKHFRGQTPRNPGCSKRHA